MASQLKEVKKEWWKSKTIWAAVASLVVAIGSAMYGETDPMVGALIAVFSSLGLYGRTVAKGPVGWRKE